MRQPRTDAHVIYFFICTLYVQLQLWCFFQLAFSYFLERHFFWFSESHPIITPCHEIQSTDDLPAGFFTYIVPLFGKLSMPKVPPRFYSPLKSGGFIGTPT